MYRACNRAGAPELALCIRSVVMLSCSVQLVALDSLRTLRGIPACVGARAVCRRQLCAVSHSNGMPASSECV